MTYPILPGGHPIPVAPPAPLTLGVLMSRPCACGTPVTASRLDPGPGVTEHNRTAAHREWWARVRLQWQGEERP